MNLVDAKVLITGGTSGIGYEIAHRLKLAGAQVAITGRNGENLFKAATELGVHRIQADVSVEADAIRSVNTAKEQMGGLNVLINNAGFGINKAFTMSELKAEQEMFDVLVRTPMRLMHGVLPGMKQRNKGVVINVSSVAGYIAGGSYSAAKSYLTVISESLHTELADTNIKVSALCPGFTRTEFHQRGRMSMKGLPNFMWLDSDTLVAKAWSDALKGKAVSIPGWQYQILVFVIASLPRSIIRKVGMNLRAKQRK
jgi:short-subunit dehydrogenase